MIIFAPIGTLHFLLLLLFTKNPKGKFPGVRTLCVQACLALAISDETLFPQ